LLLTYGCYGIFSGELIIFGGRSFRVYLHGEPVWIFCASLFAAALHMLSTVVNYYNSMGNEAIYGNVAKITKWAAWFLLAVAILAEIFFFNKSILVAS
jgi:hypothetical protein